MKYSKPPLTIKDQIKQLKSRGLVIADESAAEEFLTRVSYYRFSAYLLPFQLKDGSHTFKPKATFEKAYNSYLFDRELRHNVFNAIEKIEVAIRSRLINIFSLNHGGWWYSDSALFFNTSRHSDSIDRLRDDIRKSNEIFIKHYKNKYTDPPLPPAWMALEVMSFGNLSKLYKNIKKGKVKDVVAGSFDLPDVIFTSWLESLTFVRNTCAHHARLWNRELTIKPKVPKRIIRQWLTFPPADDGRLYLILAVIHYLLRSIGDDGKFYLQIKSLIENNPAIPLHPMGFPANWRDDQFWKM